MAKEPLVTVVICCYNYAEFVGDSIESVYRQTYKNIQLIVINDGSSDDSHQVITNLQKKNKFNYINQENTGVIKCIEKSLTMAEGDYFIHLAADDVIVSNYIEALVKAAQKNKQMGIFYTDLINLDTDEVILKAPKFNKEALKHYNFIHGTSMVAMRLMKNIRYDDNLRGLGLEDWDFFLAAVLGGERAKYVSNTHLRYRKHPTIRSRSQLRRKKGTSNGLRAIEYILSKNIKAYPDEMQYFSWLRDHVNEAITYVDRYNKDIGGLRKTLADMKVKSELQEEKIKSLSEHIRSVEQGIPMRFSRFINKFLYWR